MDKLLAQSQGQGHRDHLVDAGVNEEARLGRVCKSQLELDTPQDGQGEYKGG